jgi:hypothetical protein
MIDVLCAFGGGDLRKQEAAKEYIDKEGRVTLFTGEPLSTLPTLYQQYGVTGITPKRQSKDTPDDLRVLKEVMAERGFTSTRIITGINCFRAKVLAPRILGYAYHYEFVCVNEHPSLWRRFIEGITTVRQFFTVWG